MHISMPRTWRSQSQQARPGPEALKRQTSRNTRACKYNRFCPSFGPHRHHGRTKHDRSARTQGLWRDTSDQPFAFSASSGLKVLPPTPIPTFPFCPLYRCCMVHSAHALLAHQLPARHHVARGRPVGPLTVQIAWSGARTRSLTQPCARASAVRRS